MVCTWHAPAPVFFTWVWAHAAVSPCVQLSILSEEKEALLNLWEVRRQQYEQCMDLQLFYRDTEQVDNWMSKQEVSVPVPVPVPPAFASPGQTSGLTGLGCRPQAFLLNEDLGDSLDSVEALLKKHEDFEKSLSAQEEKITVSYARFDGQAACVV